ncbi:hypothetical protein [Kitasatospora viridis]|uniref:Periplasmic binding family protein n=1 Tax=Kitasatospora viridis TaxID=281105 RepID=A0A561SE96_9ACTN|nr:hypothetical protein [Kitasatospora viridis]TWF73196.1 hypothetical protein FHX73_16347 [Kitasatospora viridis]
MRNRALPALFATAALVLGTAAAAQADPPPPPPQPEVVGVGTEADQTLFNQLSADYNASLAAAGDTTSARFYSWDQTGASPIVPKPGGSTIVRPDNGRTGLAALNDNTSSTLDFDRSVMQPLLTDPTSDDFVALAVDAVSWAAPAGGNAPANLSSADLFGIYDCAITNWNQITDIAGYSGPNARIVPVAPQFAAGDPNGLDTYFQSDTATVFNGAVVTTTGSNRQPRLGGCVVDGPADNEGTDPVFSNPNTLVPYSAGRYAGQLNGHATTADSPGKLTIRSIDGVSPVEYGALNPDFTATNYGYLLEDVVRDAEWNGSADLQNILGPMGWVCNSATAQADLASEGFQVLPAGACGSVVHS